MSLIDAALVPEVYAGKWVARKKFATCFTFSDKHETETFVEKDAPLASELHRVDEKMGALYLLKDVHDRVVEVVNKDRLQELCKR